MTIRVEPAEDDVLWNMGPLDPGAVGQVRAVIPILAGGVVKILHPIFERPGVPDDGRTWDGHKKEPESDGHLERLLKESVHVYSTPGGDDDIGRRVLWKEVIETLDLVWHPEINSQTVSHANGGSWPARLWGPAEGDLDEVQLQVVLDALASSGSTRTAIASHPVFRCEPMEHVRWRFELGDFLATRHHPVNTFGEGPDSVMATDGSWYLLQDIDSPFTLLSASEQVIEKVMASPLIEAFRLEPRHSISWKSDTTNEKRKCREW